MEYIRLARPNQIELTRGDSETFEVEIAINGEIYTPVTGDEIRFAMREESAIPSRGNYFCAPALIKDVPIDTMQLTFEPKDTKHLPFGNYRYDMKITFADGDVKTFVKDAPFILTREVD